MRDVKDADASCVLPALGDRVIELRPASLLDGKKHRKSPFEAARQVMIVGVSN